MRPRPAARAGAILILVAGLASILASLTLAFLLRMRTDQDEGQQFTRMVQARIMVTAALLYIQETARIGWDDPLDNAVAEKRHEAFGWVDIRDGRPGPCDQLGERLFTGDADGVGPDFPAIGGTARCPMQVLRRPPYAIALDATPNPMRLDPALMWQDILGNERPDPAPAKADLGAFTRGDPAPRSPSIGWFRVHRKRVPGRPAVFVITASAGATAGFADWTEVQAAGAEAMFGDPARFLELRAEESLLWFEAEWNPAAGHNAMHHYHPGSTPQYRLNRLGHPAIDGFNEDRPNCRQFGGTFLYIQRLADQPAAW